MYLSPKTGLPTCPVNMLNRYLNLASIENTSQEFIFSSLYLSNSENVYKLQRSRQLSYTRHREMLLAALEGNGLDKKKIGLHNLRSGGARAAPVAGIDDRLLKKHGRWKSDKAKDYLFPKIWVFKCFILAFDHLILELCCTLSGELIL